MTILFLSRRFYPKVGGVETHVLQISKELLKQNHQVAVVTETEPDVLELQSEEDYEGIKILRISAGKDDWTKKYRIWSELLKHVDQIRKADIVHCHDVFFWFLPFRFLFPFKKVYTTFHGHETSYPPAKKAILIRKMSEILSFGNICIGDYIIKWYYTKPNFVLYGGVNIDKNSPSKADQPKGEKLKIVFIGRLENDLGVKTYLKSLEVLKKKKIKFEFEAYGEGPLAKFVKKYGKVQGFTENVNLAIESADIVFASSYLIMLQALLAKKIIVAVYENNLKEDYLRFSPFAEYIYICNSANDVTAVIGSIAKDPWKSSAMSHNGYEWAREQTWERVAETYLKLWKI